MKHLLRFNENKAKVTQELIHSLVDWKIVYFIRDAVSMYEDMDIDLSISVYAYSDNDGLDRDKYKLVVENAYYTNDEMEPYYAVQDWKNSYSSLVDRFSKNHILYEVSFNGTPMAKHKNKVIKLLSGKLEYKSDYKDIDFHPIRMVSILFRKRTE